MPAQISSQVGREKNISQYFYIYLFLILHVYTDIHIYATTYGTQLVLVQYVVLGDQTPGCQALAQSTFTYKANLTVLKEKY